MEKLLNSAFRVLKKEKGFAVLNIFGMALGLAVALIMLQYILFQVSYDRFMPDYRNTYRVYLKEPGNVFLGKDEFNVVPKPLAPELDKLPEVESWSRLKRNYSSVKSDNEQKIDVNSFYVEEGFTDIYPPEVLQGDVSTLFNSPNKVILTESLSEKLFQDNEAVGRTIELYDNDERYTIAAVIRDLPDNSHLNFQMLFSFDELDNMTSSWSSRNTSLYVKLEEGTDPEEMGVRITDMVNSHLEEKGEEYYKLQALYKIHIFGDINFEFGNNLDVKTLYLYGFIAIGILLLSIVNYVNLSTARAQRRQNEVYIRKVNGSSKKQLVFQFLSESYVMLTFAFVVAILIMKISLPWLSVNLFGLDNADIKGLFTSGIWSVLFWSGLIILFVIVGFLAGLYPSVYTISRVSSKTKPAAKVESHNNNYLRNGLIVSQFVITTFLTGSVVFFSKQLNYIQHKDLGFQQKDIVYYRLNQNGNRNYSIIKNELKSLPGVLDVTGSTYLPSGIRNRRGEVDLVSEESSQLASMYVLDVDAGFLDFYGIPILAGRGLRSGFAKDSTGSMLVNKTFVEQYQLKDPLGAAIKSGESSIDIVGVTGDFNFASLEQGIEPLMIRLSDQYWGLRYLSVKVQNSNNLNLLSKIDNLVKKYTMDEGLEHYYLSELINKSYSSEQLLSQRLLILAVIAVFIACIGLTGLASYLALRRKKEIAVRKVLGATPNIIYRLLNVKFISLIVLANLIGLPLCWYFVRQWLGNYAYRIDLDWYVFIMVCLSSIILTVITISILVYKTVNINPARVIRE